MAEPTTEMLRKLGLELGLTAVGVAEAAIAEPARTVLHLRRRAGLAGDMQFTYRNPDRSTDPSRRLPTASTVVVGALRYESEAPGVGSVSPTASSSSAGRPTTEMPAIDRAGRIARYVWHDHYARLEAILDLLADLLIDAGYRAHVLIDSNHQVDRHVAWRAGIGWYGKNANLLLPGAGSWFVLGSILTDAPLRPAESPQVDGCGSCQRCIDDCPTGAIVAPGVVDARRCLAWLVQAGGELPSEYRVAVGDRIYGCDDCQEVCPPNRAQAPRPAEIEPRIDLEWLLTASDEAILDRHGRWYIADRNVDVVRRTGLVALGNTARPDWGRGVVELIRRHLDGQSDLLRNHAVWAARRLGLDIELPRCCSAPINPTGTAAASPGRCVDPDLHRELRQPVDARFTPGDWESF